MPDREREEEEEEEAESEGANLGEWFCRCRVIQRRRHQYIFTLVVSNNSINGNNADNSSPII